MGCVEWGIPFNRGGGLLSVRDTQWLQVDVGGV